MNSEEGSERVQRQPLNHRKFCGFYSEMRRNWKGLNKSVA